MATLNQAAASRANSLKSTGPRTIQGKAVSRFNALKLGVFSTKQLLFDETAEDHAQLTAEYNEQYIPDNAAECILVETLIANEWRLRRLRRVEDQLWTDASFHFIVLNLDTTITSNSAQAFATESSKFERLQQVVNSCERAYHRALQEIHSAQAARAQCQAQALCTPQPEQSKTTSSSPASFRKTPATPLALAPEPPPAAPFPAPLEPHAPACPVVVAGHAGFVP